MKRDEIDQILLEEPRLVPSGHFAAAVMDAVQREHRDRGPLPFPWGRLLLGMGLCVALSVAGGVQLAAAADMQQVGLGQIDASPWIVAIEDALRSPEVAWTAGSLAGSALLVWLTLAWVRWLASIQVSSRCGIVHGGSSAR